MQVQLFFLYTEFVSLKLFILFSVLTASLVGSILAWKAVINRQQKFDRLEQQAAEGDPIGGLENIKGFSQVVLPANSNSVIKSWQRALSSDGKELGKGKVRGI